MVKMCGKGLSFGGIECERVGEVGVGGSYLRDTPFQ